MGNGNHYIFFISYLILKCLYAFISLNIMSTRFILLRKNMCVRLLWLLEFNSCYLMHYFIWTAPSASGTATAPASSTTVAEGRPRAVPGEIIIM